MKSFRPLLLVALLMLGLQFSHAQGIAMPYVGITTPTNNQVLYATSSAGTTVPIRARVYNTNVVQTVSFYLNGSLARIVTNFNQVTYSNTAMNADGPFYYYQSNLTVGAYVIRAVSTDSLGGTATSAPVSITVTSAPPVVVRPTVTIYSPSNGMTFTAPASINLYAVASKTNGYVISVQFLANGATLGVVSNSGVTAPSTQFQLPWQNIGAGIYELRAIALDNAGLTATSSVVKITVVSNTPPPTLPFAVALTSPTNNQTFRAPAVVTLRSTVVDSNVVNTVQYFAGDLSLGIVTNIYNVLLTNTAGSSTSPFVLTWSNAPAGEYNLKAIASDSAGRTATSSVVRIVITNYVPPTIPFTIALISPANNQTFAAGANILFRSSVVDSNVVNTVEYFSGDHSLGVVSNLNGILSTNANSNPTSNPFNFNWSNAPAGSYNLRAVATDSTGLTATSSVVHITITNVPPPTIPFVVALTAPANNQVFTAPTNLTLRALAVDSNVVNTVEFIAGDHSLGLVSNIYNVLTTNTAGSSSSPFTMVWSNVAAGVYNLKAIASDAAGRTATSSVVKITVTVATSNTIPVVGITATDPIAVEGTNLPPTATTVSSNYYTGGNTATFLVKREGPTNAPLTVYYHIGGTASNGSDYLTLPGSVVIPAGARYALITIWPLLNEDEPKVPYETVILELVSAPNDTAIQPTYLISTQRRAGAAIYEQGVPTTTNPGAQNTSGDSVRVTWPATNGLNYYLQVSTNYTDWTTVSTNTVLKGSAQFVDPGSSGTPNQFYRIVPAPEAPSY